MKNLTNQHSLKVLIAGATLLAVLLLGSFADARDSRDRSADRGEETAVTPTPAPILIDNGSSSGSISNDTSADVETGDNTGGKVTTGDESAEEHEINVGPTNPNPAPPLEEPEPVEGQPDSSAPENSCDGRTRTNCDAESPSRER